MIEINNLYFSYSKGLVLDNISTTFEHGKIYGLLGDDGVGKSTLLKLLSGLLVTRRGSIDIGGCSPVGRKPSCLSKIYYVSEDFEGMDMLVKNYVAGVAPFYPDFDAGLLDCMFKDFGIDANRKFASLSKCNRKKAIIAIALSLKSDYLFIDEPTDGFDIQDKNLFRKMLAATMDDNRTIIISTRQLKDVEGLIDHIIMLDKGAVLLDKSVSDIQREYRFEVSASAPEDALYFAPGSGGCYSISPNNTGEESAINIELLFDYINSKK